MLTLTRARSMSGQAGEPLPTVYDKLGSNTVHIRRGQLTLIAAAPGVGKSLFTLKLAKAAKVPGYYFSADTDAFTMYCRAAAMSTGWRVRDIESSVMAGNIRAIDAKLNEDAHLRFDFNAQPSCDDIEEELMAFAATYGQWPELVVIDNLRNMWTGEEGGSDLDGACDYLHELARKTGAAVVTLHHVKGEYNTGTTPIPLSGLIGQIGKVPELILTLHKSGDIQPVTLNVSPVKNRTGRADPSGSWVLPLTYEPERMLVEG